MELRLSDVPIFRELRWLVEAAAGSSTGDLDAHFAPAFADGYGDVPEAFVRELSALLPVRWNTPRAVGQFGLVTTARDPAGNTWLVEIRLEGLAPHRIANAALIRLERPLAVGDESLLPAQGPEQREPVAATSTSRTGG